MPFQVTKKLKIHKLKKEYFENFKDLIIEEPKQQTIQH